MDPNLSCDNYQCNKDKIWIFLLRNLDAEQNCTTAAGSINGNADDKLMILQIILDHSIDNKKN